MLNKEYSFKLDDKELKFIFSDLAEQAHSSVIAKCGETIILATVVTSDDESQKKDFFNLTVDYVERFYATGKILGSPFIRREGRPSNKAILSSRVIDRTLRPLFPENFRNPVQVVITVLSIDEENDPTVLAINAASLALATSSVPWNGPVGAIRISRDNQENISFNSIQKKYEDNIYDFIICGKEGRINMIEAGAFEISEEEVAFIFDKALEKISEIEEFQKEIIKEVGKKKIEIEKVIIDPEVEKLFQEIVEPKMEDAIFNNGGNGVLGKKKINELHKTWKKTLEEKFPEKEDFYFEEKIFDDYLNKILHEAAIKENRRADGRKMDEIRPIFVKAGGFSKVLHGSGIFYRGGTHVFSALTLGGPGDACIVDGMETQQEEIRFMHHYNFPPFSSGEIGRVTITGRREIGHGNLAEKALLAIIPSKEKFPYTIRVVSEVFASNGSTSMASVCASCLALADGGVPIKSYVAGIAIGLMYQDEENYKILVDIQGPEDHHGDMDFKVAGTRKGITAVQLDIKIEGISKKILLEAFQKAKIAREQILDILEREIPSPRPNISSNAPRIAIIKIKPTQIGLVIGVGGKTINGIKEKTNVDDITIEEDGTIYITGKGNSIDQAVLMIEAMTHEYVVGEITQGKITKVVDFGAFVKLNEANEGLVHISEIAPWRISKVSSLLKEGDIVPVKVISIDENGKLALSIKAANPNFFKK